MKGCFLFQYETNTYHSRPSLVYSPSFPSSHTMEPDILRYTTSSLTSITSIRSEYVSARTAAPPRVQPVIGNEQGAIADEGHRSYGKSRTIMIVNRFLPIPKLPRFLLSHPSFPIHLHRSSRIGRVVTQVCEPIHVSDGLSMT